MPFVFKRLALLLSIAAAFGADKDSKFTAQPASSYPCRQSISQVTVAVDPVVSDEKAKTAFGKHNPYNYGILPILVVIQNDSSKTMRIDQLQIQYIGLRRTRIDFTPAKDIRFLQAPRRPDVMSGPSGKPKILKHKNPLEEWEIEGRAFAARMLPPGQSASGFFYFQTGFQKGSQLYLTGIKEADSGKELFYYEIPLAE